MASLPYSTTLGDRKYLALVVRLAVEQGGQTIQGELLDTTGALHTPFRGRANLHRAIDAWLTAQSPLEVPPFPADAEGTQ